MDIFAMVIVLPPVSFLTNTGSFHGFEFLLMLIMFGLFAINRFICTALLALRGNIRISLEEIGQLSTHLAKKIRQRETQVLKHHSTLARM